MPLSDLNQCLNNLKVSNDIAHQEREHVEQGMPTPDVCWVVSMHGPWMFVGGTISTLIFLFELHPESTAESKRWVEG
jgi:hypothetical protein